MNLYHVVTAKSKAEIEAIKEIRPPKILISYFYFKNRLLADFIEEIGYKPEIFLDSGAYSAWSRNKNISPIDYMNYILNNLDYINKYIALDVIGDSELTIKYFEIMRLKGFYPVPVYHYGDPEEVLKYYIEMGIDYIALGNTVPIQNKGAVAAWINELMGKYPAIKFHLLGSSSRKIIEGTKIYSVDSSTWFIQAIKGLPKHIIGVDRAAKIERAKYNMKEELKKYG
jgi:hypothetical protein